MLDRFCDRIWLEEGLARATLDSYRSDLTAFARWVRGRGGLMTAATEADIQEYLSHLFAVKRASARTASRALSSLKRFYGLAARERWAPADPTIRVCAPKLPRSLPKAPSERDVEALLNAPDVDTERGLRDRAMLETLYATGLRVSELVGLKIVQVSLDMGVVRVMGKGSRERLVPLGGEADAWITRYLAPARSALALMRVSISSTCRRVRLSATIRTRRRATVPAKYRQRAAWLSPRASDPQSPAVPRNDPADHETDW